MEKPCPERQTSHSLLRAAVSRARIDYRYITRHVSEFARDLGRQGLIIDIGAGSSPYRHYFEFDQYVSLDIGVQDGLDVVGDACSLPFAAHCADVVICAEVLEHARYPRKALLEANRLLKEGGGLILTTPLLNGVHGETDFARWTAAGLAVCLKETGFKLQKIRPRGGVFSVLGGITQRVPRELLGQYPGQSGDWQRLAYYAALFGLHAALAPLATGFTLLDGLDTRKNFTLGYSVLAKKGAASGAGEPALGAH